MSVVVPNFTPNLNVVPSPRTTPNMGMVPRTRLDTKPKGNLNRPIIPLNPLVKPNLSPPVKISKNAKFAQDFLETTRRFKAQEEYEQGISDYLGIPRSGGGQLFPLTVKIVDGKEIQQGTKSIPRVDVNANLNNPRVNVPPPVSQRPPTDMMEIDPVTRQMVATSTQTVNEMLARSTDRGVQTPRTSSRTMETSTTADQMVADALSPPIQTIVHNNYINNVRNVHRHVSNVDNRVTQQHQHLHQHIQNVAQEHYHDQRQFQNVVQEHLHQYAIDASQTNNVLQQVLQQQQINQTLNQQQNMIHNQLAQNNLNLTFDARSVNFNALPLAQDLRVIEASPQARLAIEDREGPLVEELPNENQLIPRGRGVVSKRTRENRVVRRSEPGYRRNLRQIQNIPMTGRELVRRATRNVGKYGRAR